MDLYLGAVGLDCYPQREVGKQKCSGFWATHCWGAGEVHDEVRRSLEMSVPVCTLSHFTCVQLFVTLWTGAPRLLCPWDSPGKNTGVGSHSLFQGIFPTRGLNLCLPVSPALLMDSLPTEPPGKSINIVKSPWNNLVSFCHSQQRD